MLAVISLFCYSWMIIMTVPKLSVISPVYYSKAPISDQYDEIPDFLQQAYFSHRGDSIDYPEHSFAAYDSAIKKGSDYIEQDLVISKDGTLYVSHDDNAERMTGVNQDYNEMTDEQIDALRIENGESIHSLQAVIDRYGSDVTYVIEVRPVEEEVQAFINIVKKNKIEENVIDQSEDLEQIAEIKEAFPGMPVLFLAMDLSDVTDGLADENVDIICVNKNWMTSQMADWVHSYGKLFSVWTLDTEEEMEKARTVGVDVFFTDDTGLAEKMTKGEAQ